MKQYNLAIVGATGAVGYELMKVLAERKFPIGELRLLASERSKGKKITYCGKEYEVGVADKDAFSGIDVVLFAGGSISKELAPAAVAAGAVVIDNSSTFRYDPEVPLVVPEVNPEDVAWHKGIIANPNCSTIQMVVALKPIYDAVGIKRVIVSTYQAVSGAGKEAIDELTNQVKAVATGEEPKVEVFNHQIAFNLIPQIDVFKENDYTKEEMKMTWETQKMFHDENIKVSATCVRVPVYRSHSEAVTIETERPITPAEVRALLAKSPGIIVQDDPAERLYPMPLYTSDTDEVYVGRIRQDIALDNGISMWVVADQIRKGAATNAVQIAQLLAEKGMI